MKNKILVDVYVPCIDESYNIYIPLNKNVADIICLIGKSINEMKRYDAVEYNNFKLYNRENALVYSPELIILDTNIRNSSKLIMM